ncbi:hypothetical protein CWM88_15125 [Klebsiella pneumoniae]|nr:hypothetical protein CWM88_15125 [Klebsiella pneumoniae]
MIYVITDNQFLFAGMEFLLRKHDIAVSRLSVNALHTHAARKEHVFFIECAFHEENYHCLGQLYCSGARVYHLMKRSILCAQEDPPQFIDITATMNIFAPTVLKVVYASVKPAVNTVYLTNREFTVARLVLCGRSDEDIASALLISKRSSQDYINRVLKKLGGKSVADIFMHRNMIYGSRSALTKRIDILT